MEILDRSIFKEDFENIRGGDENFFAVGRDELFEFVDGVEDFELLPDVVFD